MSFIPRLGSKHVLLRVSYNNPTSHEREKVLEVAIVGFPTGSLLSPWYEGVQRDCVTVYGTRVGLRYPYGPDQPWGPLTLPTVTGSRYGRPGFLHDCTVLQGRGVGRVTANWLP